MKPQLSTCAGIQLPHRRGARSHHQAQGSLPEQEHERHNQARRQQREGRRKPQRKGWGREQRGGGWQEESELEREDGEGRGRRGDGRQCLLIFCLAAFGAIAPRSWSRSTLY